MGQPRMLAPAPQHLRLPRRTLAQFVAGDRPEPGHRTAPVSAEVLQADLDQLSVDGCH